MTPRIASLLPSATEIVCALGLEDALVGVSHECDHPPSVVGRRVLTSSRLRTDAPSDVIDRDVRARIPGSPAQARIPAMLGA